MSPVPQHRLGLREGEVGESTPSSAARSHHFCTVESRAVSSSSSRARSMRPSSSDAAPTRVTRSNAASHSRAARYADRQIPPASPEGTRPSCALRSSRKTRASGWRSRRPSRSASSPTSRAAAQTDSARSAPRSATASCLSSSGATASVVRPCRTSGPDRAEHLLREVSIERFRNLLDTGPDFR